MYLAHHFSSERSTHHAIAVCGAIDLVVPLFPDDDAADNTDTSSDRSPDPGSGKDRSDSKSGGRTQRGPAQDLAF
jgi:hypothetical protein